ncbi:MAG TPA: c-type cytochrome [Woeseiaceae bacterium]|nr:c-type cytochrome [Woeseiaceae bacterium]
MYCRRALIFLTVASAATFSALAGAADEPVIPPEEFVYCTVCHGVQMKGNPNIEAPRLSGMSETYIERQLHAFKNGWRGTHENDLVGMEMRPMAAILSDDEIAAAARYVNAVSSEPPPATIAGDAGRGDALYAPCAACHGSDGRGVAALGGPALIGLNDWYLVRQLENFKDGTRGSSPGDTHGAQMRAATATLTDDDDIRDVVTYINSLQTR